MEAGSQLHPRPWHRKTPGLFAPFFPLSQLVAARWSGLSPALETHMGTGRAQSCSQLLQQCPPGALDTGTLRSDVPQSSYADQSMCSQDTFKGKGRDFPMTQANKQACCPGTGSPLHFAISCITTNSPRHSSGRASGRLYPQQPFRRLHGRARALPVCMCEEYLRTWDGTKGLRTVSSKRWPV